MYCEFSPLCTQYDELYRWTVHKCNPVLYTSSCITLFTVAPQPQKEIERFGYVIGRPGIVNVTVHANPKPSFVWRINGEQINEGRPDESNRLQTSTSVDLVRRPNTFNDARRPLSGRRSRLYDPHWPGKKKENYWKNFHEPTEDYSSRPRPPVRRTTVKIQYRCFSGLERRDPFVRGLNFTPGETPGRLRGLFSSTLSLYRGTNEASEWSSHRSARSSSFLET